MDWNEYEILTPSEKMERVVNRLREENACLKAEMKKLRRYHEALLDTLARSKSPWIQRVWRNAKSAYTGINYGDRGGPAEWGE